MAESITVICGKLIMRVPVAIANQFGLRQGQVINKTLRAEIHAAMDNARKIKSFFLGGLK